MVEPKVCLPSMAISRSELLVKWVLAKKARSLVCKGGSYKMNMVKSVISVPFRNQTVVSG